MRRRVLISGRAGDLFKRLGYWLVVVLLFGAIGAAAGRLVLPDSPASSEPTGPLVIGRQEVDPESPPEEEARRIAREFAQAKVTLLHKSFERELTRDRLGLRLDQSEAVRLITEWRRPESVMRRYREASGARGPTAIPVPVVTDVEAMTRSLMAIKEEFDVEASDAHVDLDKRRVVSERVGRRLNVVATAADLQWSARSELEQVKLSVVTFEPRVRESALEEVSFDHVIGWFKTPYSQMRKDRHRTYNLSLAAKSLAGQVVMPGDVFSFNDVVGERSEARGYRVATVIASGQLVDGMGGGTCQIAGTLHASAFFAGLEIVDREPHSRPSSYIRVGLDATVSYPNIDLKLKNPFDFPVVVGMKVTDGWVHGEILGPERELTVTYVRTILETKAPPTRTLEDDSMPRGLKVVQQRGVPGYLVRRWRIFQRGRTQWRHEGLDRYPPTPHVVKVGTNSALALPEDVSEPAPPLSDACNMKIVQGPMGLFEEQTACR